MRTINSILFIGVVLVAQSFYPVCRMKYKEHFLLKSMHCEILLPVGNNEHNELLLDSTSYISEGKNFLLHTRFGFEYFSLGKTKSHPRAGSLGPTDTIQSLHVILKMNDGTVLKLDELLRYDSLDTRVVLKHPKPIPGYNWNLRNPKINYSSLSDFIEKYNFRQAGVLFDELEGNGILLSCTLPSSQSFVNGQTLKIISTLTFTDGRMLADTVDVLYKK